MRSQLHNVSHHQARLVLRTSLTVVQLVFETSFSGKPCHCPHAKVTKVEHLLMGHIRRGIFP